MTLRKNILVLALVVLVLLPIFGLSPTAFAEKVGSPTNQHKPLARVQGVTDLALTVFESNDKIVVGTSNFAIDFYKSYNTLKSLDGAVLASKEQMSLELKDKDVWKAKGEVTKMSWERVDATTIIVNKFFTASDGTDYVVVYTVTNDGIGIVIDLFGGVHGDYRMRWISEGIKATKIDTTANKVSFGEGFGKLTFDWGDVEKQFGDVTKLKVDKKDKNGIQEQNIDIVSDVGLFDGKVKKIDPVILIQGYYKGSFGQSFYEAIPTETEDPPNYTPPTTNNGLAATLGSVPYNGSTLIATFTTYANPNDILAVSQTGVTWARVTSAYESSYKYNSEIWVGYVNSTTASKNIYVTWNATTWVMDYYGYEEGYYWWIVTDYSCGRMIVAEYQGLSYLGAVDQTAKAISSSAGLYGSTGTTNGTTVAEELWVGVVGAEYKVTNATNGFAIINYADITYAFQTNYLWKVVNETGQASTTVKLDTSQEWAGCMATFIDPPIMVSQMGLVISAWVMDDKGISPAQVKQMIDDTYVSKGIQFGAIKITYGFDPKYGAQYVADRLHTWVDYFDERFSEIYVASRSVFHIERQLNSTEISDYYGRLAPLLNGHPAVKGFLGEEEPEANQSSPFTGEERGNNLAYANWNDLKNYISTLYDAWHSVSDIPFSFASIPMGNEANGNYTNVDCWFFDGVNKQEYWDWIDAHQDFFSIDEWRVHYGIEQWADHVWAINNASNPDKKISFGETFNLDYTETQGLMDAFTSYGNPAISSLGYAFWWMAAGGEPHLPERDEQDVAYQPYIYFDGGYEGHDWAFLWYQTQSPNKIMGNGLLSAMTYSYGANDVAYATYGSTGKSFANGDTYYVKFNLDMSIAVAGANNYGNCENVILGKWASSNSYLELRATLNDIGDISLSAAYTGGNGSVSLLDEIVQNTWGIVYATKTLESGSTYLDFYYTWENSTSGDLTTTWLAKRQVTLENTITSVSFGAYGGELVKLYVGEIGVSNAGGSWTETFESGDSGWTKTYTEPSMVQHSGTLIPSNGAMWMIQQLEGINTQNVATPMRNNVKQVTIQSGYGGYCNLSVGTYNLLFGEQFALSATPNANYNFIGWSIDNSWYGGSSPLVFKVNNTQAIRPVFSGSGGGSYYTLHVSANSGHGETNITTGNYLQNTVVALSATAWYGYQFDHWVVDGSTNVYSSTTTLTMSAERWIDAVFTPITPTVYFTTSVTGGGSINIYPALQDYGITVSVTAEADEDYFFDYWLLDGVDVGNTNPIGVLQDANHSLTAVFTSQYGQLNIFADPSGYYDLLFHNRNGLQNDISVEDFSGADTFYEANAVHIDVFCGTTPTIIELKVTKVSNQAQQTVLLEIFSGSQNNIMFCF